MFSYFSFLCFFFFFFFTFFSLFYFPYFYLCLIQLISGENPHWACAVETMSALLMVHDGQYFTFHTAGSDPQQLDLPANFPNGLRSSLLTWLICLPGEAVVWI